MVRSHSNCPHSRPPGLASPSPSPFTLTLTLPLTRTKVIDPREGFIFHVLPDPTGLSAIWVAQRVPDGHVGVVANMFSIRHVLPDVSTGGQPDFLYSASVHAVAQACGWWKAKP